MTQANKKRPLIAQQPEQVDNSIIAERESFLNRLYKNLSGLIEIREIGEGTANKKYFNSVDEALKYNPPLDKNIYIGMFTRQRKRGRNEDIKEVQALWLDFDDVESYIQVEYILNMKGLPQPSLVVASGHGFHCYWLLDEPAGREIEPVLKELARITEADSRAAELARIMRVPGTMNVKDKPVECRLMSANDKKYNLEMIADHLGVEAKAMKKAEKGQRRPEQAAAALNIDYMSIRSQVSWPCIKSILEGVGEGQRNWALGRITTYFRNVAGYSKAKTKKIVKVWNLYNDPPLYDDELKNSFSGYWHGNYNLLGCKIPDKPDLQQILEGHCDRNNCKIAGHFRVKDNRKAVVYNNRIIKRLKKIHGTSLIIYAILEKHEEGLTRKRVSEIANITMRTFSSRVKELIKLGFVEKQSGNRRRGIPDIYKVKRQGTYGTGRTAVSYGAVIAAAAGAIRPPEYKVYILLNYYLIVGQNERVFPSTFTIGEKLGIDQSTASIYIKRLQKKDFIEVNKTDEGHNEYILNI